MKITIILLLFVTILLIIGCSSDKIDPDITGDPIYGYSDTFIQKVIIEEVTGAWCGYCVDGSYRLETLKNEYPDQLIGVAFHYNDELEASGLSELTDYLGGFSGVPCGAINRTLPSWSDENEILVSRGYWSYMMPGIIEENSRCGIKVESSLNANELMVTVFYVYTTQPSFSNRLTVYLTEDNITGYPQSNYYSYEYPDNDPSYIYYNEPSIITDWEHNHVLRKILSDPEGNSLPSVELGVEWSESFQMTIPSDWNISNINIVAIISSHGNSLKDKTVLNVQWCSLGETVNYSEM